MQDQRGQVVPLAAVMLLVMGALALGLVRLAATASDVAAVQAAADAAALAGVDGGEAGARRLAAANGAELVEYRERGEVVSVVVRRDGVTARASAAWTPLEAPPEGRSVHGR